MSRAKLPRMDAKPGPQITAVEWLTAKEVLGGEATDFTPWLQLPESMQILGDQLKLEELTTVAAEHNVLGKRLDILASALDEDGEEIPVCIENQYGTSDASHLGRLIAYLAQHDRGRAVWVVEDAHEAFVAAVRFLNRTSSDEVGYYLVQVRFTHGRAGGHQVHFEVLAAPLAWERSGKPRSTSGTRPVNRTKIDYLEEIHTTIRPALEAAGFASMNTHARGSYLWVDWPQNLWFRRFARRVDIRVTQHAARVSLYVWKLWSREANTKAAEILQERYGATVADRLPPGTELTWFAGAPGKQREVVLAELPGAGYVDGDPQDAARWAETVATTWLDILRIDPILDLENRVEASVPRIEGDREDDDVDEL